MAGDEAYKDQTGKSARDCQKKGGQKMDWPMLRKLQKLFIQRMERFLKFQG